jgi:hypothetical protein
MCYLRKVDVVSIAPCASFCRKGIGKQTKISGSVLIAENLAYFPQVLRLDASRRMFLEFCGLALSQVLRIDVVNPSFSKFYEPLGVPLRSRHRFSCVFLWFLYVFSHFPMILAVSVFLLIFLVVLLGVPLGSRHRFSCVFLEFPGWFPMVSLSFLTCSYDSGRVSLLIFLRGPPRVLAQIFICFRRVSVLISCGFSTFSNIFLWFLVVSPSWFS